MKQIDKIGVQNQLLVNQWISAYLTNNIKSIKRHNKEACVFLDIDGTIIQNNHAVAANSSCVLFVHNIFRKCNELGIHVFVITARMNSYSARTQTMLELEECGYYHLNKKTKSATETKSDEGAAYYDELIMMSQSDVDEFKLTIQTYKQNQNSNPNPNQNQNQNQNEWMQQLLLPSYNFSLYKFRARSKIIQLKGYVSLLTIGDQWYDILYVPSGIHFAKLPLYKKKELHQIMTTLNHENDTSIYICTGLDNIASLVGIKLPLRGLSTF
jgi:hydroxymethylpyrimidine pyrophosphatase-like HAD family hydrolase